MESGTGPGPAPGSAAPPEIAARLIIAETTAKANVARMLIKLGLRGRAQGVMVAYESGLVEPKGDLDR